MSDHRMTEQFKPYEPEPPPAYEYEYDYDDRAARPRVLWGRVAALAIALLLAFFLGRALAPGGEDEQAAQQIERLRGELADANERATSLQEQLDVANAAAQPTTQPTAEPTEATEPEVEGTEYVVQKGDTLRLIAQDKCGDPEAADQIMELNDITDPTQLSVGVTLIIPADCGS